MTRPLDLALQWAESGSASVDARVLAQEVRAMHVYVNALESQREAQTQALLRALRAEGADPVAAASFVREVADNLAARVAQLEPLLAVVSCSNPTAHEELQALRARDEKAEAVVREWTRDTRDRTALWDALSALACDHGKES